MSLYDGKRKSDHDDDSDDDDGFPLPSKQDYQAADAINASLCYGNVFNLHFTRQLTHIECV